ncbi:MAG TPA: glycosyltransferase family 4 protein [Cytophaga sp.]|nr:glycosyltransferase family 4 protein [Cytophaga sp.]
MNILHILPSSHAGGSELCVYETVKVLESEGIRNYAIYPKEGDMVSLLSNHLAGYSIIENSWWLAGVNWTFIFKLKMLRGYFLSARKIKKYIKEQSIDIVITHTLAIPSGAIAARMGNIPHIWYIHEYGDRDHGFNFVYGKKRTLNLIARLSDSIVFNSRTVAEYFSEFIRHHKKNILNAVIEYPITQPFVRKEKKSLSICMVGRISPGKNQQIVIDALSLLKQKNVTPFVTFVGGANRDYLDSLYKKILRNGLEKQIEFAGHTNTPWDYVQKADAVVVSSRMEAFGRVTIEGMKSGKIVIASNTGAGTELIQHGITGYLFDPDDPQQLADILEIVWEAENVKPIAEAAHVFACSNFNEEVHKKQIISILSSI